MKQPKWEYLSVQLNTTLTHYLDPVLKSPQLLGELGALGWELFSIVERRHIQGDLWIYLGMFKRRVE